MAYTGGRSDGRAPRARGGRQDGRREERARRREAMCAQVEERFAAEIERSLAGVQVIDGMPSVSAAAVAPAPVEVEAEVVDAAAPVPVEAEALEAEEAAVEAELEAESEPEPAPAPEVPVPSVRVVDQNAVSAILETGRGRAQFCDLAVLDCASFTKPAGGFDAGYMGQEAELCDESYLYSVLKQKRDWYGENRRRNINCELYRNRALVVPAVRFSRGKVHAYADVIVAAAPNAKRARSEYNVKDETLADAMRDRIRFVLAVADSLGHEKLILGAFGVGQFGWRADEVAEMLREELASGTHVATDVIIAVRRDRFNEDLERFEHAFAAFPAKNEEPYEDVRARRAAAQAAAEPEDDEDDDWRKYL